jgi:hypothetical protein
MISTWQIFENHLKSINGKSNFSFGNYQAGWRLASRGCRRQQLTVIADVLIQIKFSELWERWSHTEYDENPLSVMLASDRGIEIGNCWRVSLRSWPWSRFAGTRWGIIWGIIWRIEILKSRFMIQQNYILFQVINYSIIANKGLFKFLAKHFSQHRTSHQTEIM